MRESQLNRPRLIEAVAGVRRSALFAPSGYGKSTLVDQVAERLGWATAFVELSDVAVGDVPALVAAFRRGLRAAGLRLLAEALDSAAEDGAGAVDGAAAAAAGPMHALGEVLGDRDDQLLIVVDDVHVLTAEAAEVLARFVDALPAPHHVIVAGQSQPGWSQAVEFGLTLDGAALAFTVDEAADLAYRRGTPLAEAELADLVESTSGWPTAVALAVAAHMDDVAPGRDVPAARGLRALLDGLMARLDPAMRDEVRTVAQLPLLSEGVVAAVAAVAAVAGVAANRAAANGAAANGADSANADVARPGTLGAMAAAGIPMRRRADGWYVLPDPVRVALADSTALTDDAALAAATAYADEGELQTAALLLRSRGAFEALCGLLEARPWQELQSLGATELQSLVGGLPDSVIDAHPRLLVAAARMAESAARTAWRADLVARAARSMALNNDAALAREVHAEIASDLSYEGDVNGTLRMAREVLANAAADEVRTRARVLMALGRTQAFARDAASMVAAAETLTEAGALLRVVNEPEWLAHVLLRLGYSVHYAEGDLESALARIREAVAAAPMGARERATVLTFLADVLIYSGQLDEAEAVLRSMADVARRLRDQRLLGYHAWERASIASRRGDAEALSTWVAEAERHPGDWYEHPTGIEFLADAVDFYGQVGDFERAGYFLARVEERCAADRHEGVDQIALFARATHGARAGDQATAQRDLVAVLESQQLPRRETWHIYLLRGLAALRAGDREAAASFAARAFEEAAAIGHPELPSLHERAALEALLPLARRTGSSAAETVESAEPALAVRLLGEFAVSAAGRPQPPPPGRPATLVKLLAVSGASVAVDEVLEILWPEVDPDTGRARLRNVLARIKSACGELIRRDGDALTLAADVTVDALEFDRDARAALSGRADEANEIARRAVARYAGELLPTDRYEDFTVAPRERLALRYLALLDRLAVDAERNEDVDEALRLYGEAIAAAPLDEHRYEKAAALAIRSGRRGRAVELLEQAKSALAELGVEPSDELVRIVGGAR